MNIGFAVPVLAREHAIRCNGVHDGFLVGVHDRQVEPRGKRLGQKADCDVLAGREAERDIADAEHGVQPERFTDMPYGLQGFGCLVLLNRDRQGQTVDQHILLRHADFERRVQNAFRNRRTRLPGLGDAVFIQTEPDYLGAVFSAQRQNGLQTLGLAADRVYDGPAVHRPQTRLDRLRVRRVYLQGQVDHGLQGLDRAGHHRRLVDAGQADVDVQNVRAGILLFQAARNDIVKVLLPQGLLEALLPGGVDALADHPDPVKDGRVRSRTDPVLPRGFFRSRRLTAAQCRRGEALAQHADKVRRRTAAAAQIRNTLLKRRQQLFGKVFRGQTVFAGRRVRQAGVRLQDQGQIRPLAQLAHEGQQLLRPEAAVKAQGVNPERAQGQTHGRNRGADKAAARGLEGHRGPDRQAAVLLRGEDGCLDLVQIAHGLDDDQVGAGIPAGDDDFAEKLVGLFKAQGAQRLENLPQRPNVQCDQDAFAPVRGTGTAYAGFDQFRDAVAETRCLETVDAEGVGIEDAAAGFDIAAMNSGDFFGFGQVPELRQLADGQAGGLQLGAHAPVQKRDVRQRHSVFPPSGKNRFQTVCRRHSRGGGVPAGYRQGPSAR